MFLSTISPKNKGMFKEMLLSAKEITTYIESWPRPAKRNGSHDNHDHHFFAFLGKCICLVSQPDFSTHPPSYFSSCLGLCNAEAPTQTWDFSLLSSICSKTRIITTFFSGEHSPCSILALPAEYRRNPWKVFASIKQGGTNADLRLLTVVIDLLKDHDHHHVFAGEYSPCFYFCQCLVLLNKVLYNSNSW